MAVDCARVLVMLDENKTPFTGMLNERNYGTTMNEDMAVLSAHAG